MEAVGCKNTRGRDLSLMCLKLALGKMEERIGGGPSGDFPCWGRELFPAFSGIFLDEARAKCVLVGKQTLKRTREFVVHSEGGTRGETGDRFLFSSPRCCRAICLVLTWQSDCEARKALCRCRSSVSSSVPACFLHHFYCSSTAQRSRLTSILPLYVSLVPVCSNVVNLLA